MTGGTAPIGAPGRVVAYLTDAEGMWERLASFARDNPFVAFDAEGRLDVAAGAVFVYGGDAIDRGPHGRRVVAALLDVKRRRPDRVVLLAGNRDINKLRLTRELRGHPPTRTPAPVRAGTSADLLRWIFENTMGAKGAFEFRRDELGGRAAGVDDDDVVRSVLADVDPGGALCEYLRCCQLAHREGATLFVHGAVTAECLGVVPTRGRVAGLDAWIAELNAWYAAQVDAFGRGTHDARGVPAWEPLIAYQAPSAGAHSNPGSVVYNRSTDALNNPHLPGDDVIAALGAAGVGRVVVGHTPGCDAPVVLRTRGFEWIVADNSRGRVATASKLYVTDAGVDVAARAQLDDGALVDVAYHLAPGDDAPPVGWRLADGGHLVTGRLASGDYLAFRMQPGYRIEQRVVTAAELLAQRLVAPRAGT